MNIEKYINKNMHELIKHTRKWDRNYGRWATLSSLEDANFHELRKRLLKTYEEWETEVLEEEEIFKLFKRSKNGK